MRNGSGEFSLIADMAVSGQIASSTTVDAVMDDIATALTESINIDGTKAFEADQSMGGFHLTSVAAGSARTDSINLGQLQDEVVNWVIAGGTVDAITATYSPAITTLTNGMTLKFRATGANTITAPTFNPNGLGALIIYKHGSAALVAGDINGAGHEVTLRLNTTTTPDQWELLNPKVPAVGAVLTANTFTAAQTVLVNDAVTNAVTDVLKLGHTSSGTAAASFGVGILAQLENGAGTTEDAASVDVAWVDATDTTEDAKISFKTMVAGAAKTEAGYIAQGLVLGAATSGDKGAGTLNATAIYDDNVQILPLVAGSATASTSGTSIDFTGIPSTAKLIRVLFNGVSTSGTSAIVVQIGDSGGIETSGYSSAYNTHDNTGAILTSTAAFAIATPSAATAISGIVTICNVSGNIWVSSHSVASAYGASAGGGTMTLSATLDRVRITTVGGADTFDAGSINIQYQ